MDTSFKLISCMWVTIQLTFLWHGWAFPNHFKIINEQSIQKTRWRVIWNHLSVSLSVGQVNISVRSRGIIFRDFFHKLIEPKFCRKFVFAHIWAKRVPKLGKSFFYWKYFYLISPNNFCFCPKRGSLWFFTSHAKFHNWQNFRFWVIT